MGDGGFLFACGDLATAAQEGLPLTVVLVDDGGYGMLAYDFTKDGHTPLGCDLEPPDFVALAAAFRVRAREVAVPDLARAVAEGIASGQPGLLVVQGRVHAAAQHLAALVPRPALRRATARPPGAGAAGPGCAGPTRSAPRR